MHHAYLSFFSHNVRKGVYRVCQKKDSGKHKDLRNLNSEVSACTMVCVLGGGGGGGRERRRGGNK